MTNEMIEFFFPILAAVFSGIIVGMVTGMLGGGGSILSVPLLMYLVGAASPHMAIGTSAIAVSIISLGSLASHARVKNVDWRVAAAFGGLGVLGAIIGAAVAKGVHGYYLVFLLGWIMIAIGVTSIAKNGAQDPPLAKERPLPLLLSGGFAVGTFSGFFGVSAGFIIVPALRIIAGMTLYRAIGTSLAISSIFAGAVGVSYASSGLVDWVDMALMVMGGLIGSVLGTSGGRALSLRNGTLEVVFGVVIGLAGLYVVWRERGVVLGS